MDSHFEDNLKNLNQKFQQEDISFDSFDIEKCLREFKTELYIKRDQVKQLRSDLEIATEEIIELKKALDVTTKGLDEKNFNLNIISKKFRITEDELLKKVESLNTIQLQHKLMVAEIENMKQHLQKNETEKTELSRKLEVFETKQRQSFIYHNQILKRESHLRSTIEDVEEMVKKLSLEQNEVSEMAKKTKIAEESLTKCKQLSSSYENLKKEKEHFEELYVRTNAKYEMLEQLLTLNENIQEPNLMNRILFNQWKSSRSHHETQMQKNNEILNKLTDCYNNEKSTNVQLIKKNEEISQEYYKLKAEMEILKEEFKKEQKVTEMKEKKDNSDKTEIVQIKDEPIVIED